MIDENISQGKSTSNMVLVVTSNSEDGIEMRFQRRSMTMRALNKIIKIMKLNWSVIEENMRQGESTSKVVVVVASNSENGIEIRIRKGNKTMGALNKI